MVQQIAFPLFKLHLVASFLVTRVFPCARIQRFPLSASMSCEPWQDLTRTQFSVSGIIRLHLSNGWLPLKRLCLSFKRISWFPTKPSDRLQVHIWIYWVTVLLKLQLLVQTDWTETVKRQTWLSIAFRSYRCYAILLSVLVISKTVLLFSLGENIHFIINSRPCHLWNAKQAVISTVSSGAPCSPVYCFRKVII